MLLSHYTNELGLYGIVRSQALWATDFLSLNDQTEVVYALSALYEEAATQAWSQIPSNLRHQSLSMDRVKSEISTIVTQLKQQTCESDGYGSLYIVSFARGKNDDENERGILSLWDRYTRNEGYCVQFDLDNIRSLVEHEDRHHSYAWIELAEVKYGIDRQESDFLWLVAQLALRLLKSLYDQNGDRRLTPEFDKIAPNSSLVRRLLSFCGKHKDPAFIDEREIRIFACPANISEPRPFTGTASPKTIHHNSQRRARYIALGEAVLPGPIPNRIIVGPNADLPQWKINALYPPSPIITKSTIPVR